MRRWRVGAALGGALLVLLAGCSKPEGVDGDLTDDWRTIAEPRPFVPQAGTCHTVPYGELGYVSSYAPVDCAQAHNTETIYVGAFTGADAERVSLPPAGSPARRAAFAECDKQAKAYLGADWRTAQLWLGLTVPNPSAWSGGGRWYRCELIERKTVESLGTSTQHRGSLKGELSKASPLKLGCYTVDMRSDDITNMSGVACTKAHRSEFVGVFTAPDVTYPSGDKHRDLVVNGCESVLAKFAKVPDDSLVKYRAGLIWFPPDEDDWKSGDRGIRCYLWNSNRDMKKSMRNAGTSGLPVN